MSVAIVNGRRLCRFCGTRCPRIMGLEGSDGHHPAYLCPRVKVKVEQKSFGYDLVVIPPPYTEWALKHAG